MPPLLSGRANKGKQQGERERERRRRRRPGQLLVCTLANGTLSASLTGLVSMHAVPLPEQTGLQESSLIFFYLVTPCTRGAHVHAWTWTDGPKATGTANQAAGAEERSAFETVHTLCESM